MNANRVLYLDLLRIVSILGVVAIHICAVPWQNVPVNDLDWHILNVYDGAARWCVPIFVMISGALFLDPAREISPRRLFSHNILRIVTAFAFWSAAYAGIAYLLGALRGEPSSLKQVLRSFFTGHYHLWFLFAIVGLYLITPFLRRIAADKRLTQYFLLLSFVFCYGANLLVHIPTVGSVIKEMLADTHLDFIGGYAGYFLLGDYLHRHGVSSRTRHIVYILGAAGVLVTIVGTALWSTRAGAPITALYQYLLPHTALTAAAVFLFCRHHADRIPHSDRACRIITHLSSLTFGIYLVHEFFNIALNKLGISAVSINPLFGVPLLAVAVFLGAGAVTWVIRKIPCIHKYIL